MSSLQYINSKLSGALYTLTVHTGDACTRLFCVLDKLLPLFASSFSENIRNDFIWVQSMIKKGNKNPFPNLKPSKLTGIQNRTASEVIKKLVLIQYRINTLLEESIYKS